MVRLVTVSAPGIASLAATPMSGLRLQDDAVFPINRAVIGYALHII